MIELAPEERALLEEAADKVVRRGLAVPAMMFLETVSPMNMLTASMLQMASPMWRVIIPSSRIDQAARLLERREAIPELLRLIDEREESRRRGELPDDAGPDDTRRTP